MFLVTLLASLENTLKRVTRKTARAAIDSADSVEGTVPIIESSEGANSSPYSVTENPALPSDFITVGINQVTRRLESQVKSFRKLVMLTNASSVNQISSEFAPIAVVLVCRADVNPPILLDHIPHLVAGCNSTRPRSDLEGAWQPLKLILLPKGSESAIAQALGLRRAAVIAIHVSILNLCRILISDAHRSGQCSISTYILRNASICAYHQCAMACTSSTARFSKTLDSHSHQTTAYQRTKRYESCKRTKDESTSCS